ncbi:MAG: Rid family detoxifying hydrolase [Denitrobacterium sp.]|jgi:2-iminobutanoate/2-iminopropanoate deaminase|nr:Rid family detoxifying hydrolase [Denitrobacterium sp.]
MQTVSTPNAPAAIGPYSQAKIAGGFVFASGQIAIDPAVGKIVETTIEGQARQVLANVEALLEAAGTDLAHVVKTTCFLAHIEDFAAFNAIYAERFGDARPARSAVGVAGLPAGALVEVEVIAEL